MEAMALDFSSVALPTGRVLKQLPDPTADEFRRLARYIICTRFVPIVWFKCFQKRRRQRLQQALAEKSDYFNDAPPVVAPTPNSAAYPPPPPPPAVTIQTLSESAFAHSSDFITGFDSAAQSNLVKGAVQYIANRGEILMHQQEMVECVMVLLRGDVDLFVSGSPLSSASARLQRKPGLFQNDPNLPQHLQFAYRRTKGLTSTVWTQRIRGPHVFGASLCFNQQPSNAYIVCSGTVDVAFISRMFFIRCFCSMPVHLCQQLAVKAHKIRAENLPIAFPMTPARVRVCVLFQNLPPAIIDKVLVCLEPAVFTKGTIICERGAATSHIIFLRRGLVKKETAAGDSGTVYRNGATFGDRELFFKERYRYEVTALTNCDVYFLKFNDFIAIQSSNPDAKELIASAAVAARQDELLRVADATAHSSAAGGAPPSENGDIAEASPDGVSFDEARVKVPIVQLFASPAIWSDMRGFWRPKVFCAKQIVVSSADPCDKLILLSSGTVKVRYAGKSSRDNFFHVGETIGFTCLVSHRWAQTLVASTPCEAWEMTREDFSRVLRKHNVMHLVLGATMQLVQPMAVFPNRCPHVEQRVLVSSLVGQGRNHVNVLEYLHTPQMHPISMSENLLHAPWRALSEASTQEVYAGRPQKKVQLPTPRSAAKKSAPITVAVKEDVHLSVRRVTPRSNNVQFGIQIDEVKPNANQGLFVVDSVGNLQPRTSELTSSLMERTAEGRTDAPPHVEQPPRLEASVSEMQGEQKAPSRQEAVDSENLDDNAEASVFEATEFEKMSSAKLLELLESVRVPSPTSHASVSLANAACSASQTKVFPSSPPMQPQSAESNVDTKQAAADCLFDRMSKKAPVRPTSAKTSSRLTQTTVPRGPIKPQQQGSGPSWRRASAEVNTQGFSTTVRRPLSASDRFGSLMTRVFYCSKIREDEIAASDAGRGESPPRQEESRSGYLWGSTSVATPLLSSRVKNQHLSSRIHSQPQFPKSWGSLRVVMVSPSSGRRSNSPALSSRNKGEADSSALSIFLKDGEKVVKRAPLQFS